jgi:hypothetical protein
MRIAIVWWWAAGMMVAVILAEREDISPEIILFEKNSRLWAKVIISGGGRCNVTTGIYKNKELLSYYTRWADFVSHAMKQFGPKKVRKWFEDHWVPLKEEEDRRVFPVSDDGKDIVWAFLHVFHEHKVKLHYREIVETIQKKVCSDWSCSHQYQVTTDHMTYYFDQVILTAGWNAYKHTWSTGDGYGFAESLWHSISPLWPSLNSFCTREKIFHELSGISFPNASLALVDNEQKVNWPILLTHFGISWPVTFAFASQIAYQTISKQKPVVCFCKPDASKDTHYRDQWLKDAMQSQSKKDISNLLAQVFPKRFALSLCYYCQIQDNKNTGSLTKDERTKLANTLWNGIKLHLTQRKPGDEFVTAGGVNTQDIDPKTMQSLCAPWLYFAGEILNIDWLTGGFNLQSAWATAYVAAKSIK